MAGGAMSFPPGFRFHPTEEELVGYYLKKKVFGEAIDGGIIMDIDLYKFEPWDLPDGAFAPGSDRYFFSPRDVKYSHGGRTNRATLNGYWKATGKDRKITSDRVVGMKKTLVFYLGRAPKGERTDWVMHEYRMEDDHLQLQSHDSFVLCRIFNKKGDARDSGPSVPRTERASSLQVGGGDVDAGDASAHDPWGLYEPLANMDHGLTEGQQSQLFMQAFEAATTNLTGSTLVNDPVVESVHGHTSIEDPSFGVDDMLSGGLSLGGSFVSPDPAVGQLSEAESLCQHEAEPLPSSVFSPRLEGDPSLLIGDFQSHDGEYEGFAPAAYVAAGLQSAPAAMRPLDPYIRSRMNVARPSVPQMKQSPLPRDPATVASRVTPGMLENLRLTVQQWNDLQAIMRDDGEAFSTEPCDTRDVSSRLGMLERLRLTGQQWRELQGMMEDSEQNLDNTQARAGRREGVSRPEAGAGSSASGPDSIKVETGDSAGYSSRFVAGRVVRWDGACELNDVIGSDEEFVGGRREAELRASHHRYSPDDDPSMTAARTRYLPRLIAQPSARRVLHPSTRPLRGAPSSAPALSPVVQRLVEFLGPPGPAHAREICEDDKSYLDEVHLRRMRGFSSSPKLTQRELSDSPRCCERRSDRVCREDQFSDRCSEDSCSEVGSCVSVRRRARAVSGDNREPSSMAGVEPRRFLRQRGQFSSADCVKGGGSSVFTWMLACGAVLSLCVGLGSLAKLAVMYFTA